MNPICLALLCIVFTIQFEVFLYFLVNGFKYEDNSLNKVGSEDNTTCSLNNVDYEGATIYSVILLLSTGMVVIIGSICIPFLENESSKKIWRWFKASIIILSHMVLFIATVTNITCWHWSIIFIIIYFVLISIICIIAFIYFRQKWYDTNMVQEINQGVIGISKFTRRHILRNYNISENSILPVATKNKSKQEKTYNLDVESSLIKNTEE